jgi:DNA polymerase II large subunit
MNKMTAASPRMKDYFAKIQDGVDKAYAIATEARAQGFDPELFVDIKLAKNMAERVEGLISVVAPQLVGAGIPERIIELEKEYAPLDWRVALKIALEVAEQKFCTFKDKKEAMEVGIRTGFAYQTAGIVAAPLEGFIELKIKKTYDNKEYFAPCYAGPIRGAGGTAAAFSLLLTDYVRSKMGYAKYDPSDHEINRYKTEIYDYHERITNLQYLPSLEELDFLLRHLPIQVDGDPTEMRDVSNYKDTPRVETNRIRGGICLVLAEGLSQKAPKLWKRLEKWGPEFGLEWQFLREFLTLQKKIKAKKKASAHTTGEKISPNYTFITDMVAGRPVLTHPMAAGGFRLRYGRSRTSGFSAAAINPATMILLNNFVAIGTQLKVERPGKAAAITSCDTIHGPTVLLEDGTVKQIETVEEAREAQKICKKIIHLGDILFNYGDFSENGHILVPIGYNEDWWVQQLAKEMNFQNETLSKEKKQYFINPKIKKSFAECKEMSIKYKVPLHPNWIYCWSEISHEQLLKFLEALTKSKIMEDRITIPHNEDIKIICEFIGVPHLVANKEFIVIEKEHAKALLYNLNITQYDDIIKRQEQHDKEKSILQNINKWCPIKIMDKAGTTIGARMGRPEKAKIRQLTGSPQILFPVGTEGGRLRSFQAAMLAGKINADFPRFKCPKCQKEQVIGRCSDCGIKTERQYFCFKCGQLPTEGCKEHGTTKTYKKYNLLINELFLSTLRHLKITHYPDLIKGIRGTSNKDHTVEYLGKGILRAKHEIYVNKDGTIRYDMSELPITHFKPIEIGTPIQKLNELGYTKDICGQSLTEPTQICELLAQDIILPGAKNTLDEPCDEILFRVANCVDEMLQKIYKLKPFYNCEKKSDLVGHLTICLAPHISAGMVGRIIGFSKTQGFFAHPMFHAAMRRDCDGDEASVSLLMDGFLNFSRQYLPNRRGAKTMDAPLVLTSHLIPTEVDDQALGLDVVYEYPLELYEAAAAYKNPWDVPVEQLKNRVNTEGQYENIGFTHDTMNINDGVSCSAYKELPSMREKLEGQMILAEIIRAVDEADVARLVIEKHFLKDIKGNLRKFSQQKVRCVKCNEKYRRPPLMGKCTACGGKIIFTISEGSVIKYLQPSVDLGEKYDVSPYLKQCLQLLQRRVDAVFGKDKEKQTGLGDF